MHKSFKINFGSHYHNVFEKAIFDRKIHSEWQDLTWEYFVCYFLISCRAVGELAIQALAESGDWSGGRS